MAERISDRAEGGAAIAGDEACQRHAADTRCRGQLHFGIEGQERRHAVGGGRSVAEIAADGCPVLNLHGANLAGGLFQRVEGGRQRAAQNIAPTGRCADAKVPLLLLYAAKFADPRQIKKIIGERSADMGGIDIGATTQHQHILARQRFNGLAQQCWPRIHPFMSPSRLDYGESCARATACQAEGRRSSCNFSLRFKLLREGTHPILGFQEA